MKKLMVVGVGLMILAGLVVGGCGWSGIRTGERIMNNDLRIMSGQFKVFKMCFGRWPIIGHLEKWLGDKTYIVLLQNNRELRATGGFPGTYARIEFKNGGLRGVSVENLYQPDGQLPGHVEPPYPIQEAFKQGWWKLRDSNWDPDFASAAATMDWFFKEGREKPFDGIVAINISLIEEWLKITGPIKLVTYKETITSGNLYELAQTYAEEKTGAETEKREFVGAMGAALVERMKGLRIPEIWKIARVTWDQLNQKQILVWVKDPRLTKEIKLLGWDGGLETGWEKKDDYLYVVESNLGANKANCCIERQVTQEKRGNEEIITIKWTNNNPIGIPQLPKYWGGKYDDYVRVIVPRVWEIQEVEVGGRKLRPSSAEEFREPNSLRQEFSDGIYDSSDRGELQMIGFWARVEAGKSIETKLNLSGDKRRENGQVWVKRQPGILYFKYELIVDGQVKINTVINQDTQIKF